MKITIIYDDEVCKRGLKADHGFSCLIEVYNRKILFDTGANSSILLENMKKLNINPHSIDEIFISHGHWDHIEGLSDFLKINNNLRLYIPIFCPKIFVAKEIVCVGKPLKIHENIFSTGELEGIEQSLVIKLKKGLVIIVGCSHPRMKHILDSASKFGKPYALIGGLHGFSEFELLKNLELICPCHCTLFKSKIKNLYPEKCIDGGVGKIISL